jgi:hypothetical protein
MLSTPKTREPEACPEGNVKHSMAHPGAKKPAIDLAPGASSSVRVAALRRDHRVQSHERFQRAQRFPGHAGHDPGRHRVPVHRLHLRRLQVHWRQLRLQGLLI